MVEVESSQKVSKIISSYINMGWFFNFGPMNQQLGDGSRIYITDGNDTICFKVYINYESKDLGSTLDIISYPGIGFIDDILWDKKGNLEARINLE